VLPNGYLHRWLVAISTFFLLQWRFDDPRLNARANAYYNANFYRADSRDPSYRKIIVATRTRDVSTLRENLCSDLPADETDRLAQFQILDLLVHALTEGWSERALVLQSQLAAQTEKVNTLVAQVVERQHAVETLTAQLAAQTDKVNELAAQIGERQHAVEGLTAELNAIHASKFWKLISLWQSLLRRLR
jgi:septal ring factor EnvC (AmiA/AmiB activator)